MDKKRIRLSDMLEMLIGFLMDILPIVCAVLIVLGAGKAYTEGYGLFVQQGKDRPGEGHTEMVTITEEEAGSLLGVGTRLEKQELVGSRFFFALKTRLSGYEGKILPGTYILSSDMTAEQILERISVDPAAETEGDESTEASESGGGESSGEQKENRDVWGQW